MQEAGGAGGIVPGDGDRVPEVASELRKKRANPETAEKDNIEFEREELSDI